MFVQKRKMKFFGVQILAATACAWNVSAQVAALDAESAIPYIDPIRSCMTEGLRNPQGKSFRYLYSRDCRTVFVLPPQIMSQNIRSRGVNLNACDSVKSQRDSILKQDRLINEMQVRRADYELELDTAKGHKVAEIQAKLEGLNKRINDYINSRKEAESNLNNTYGVTPGAIFSIAIAGDIDQNDLLMLRADNDSLLNRVRTVEVHSKDAQGKDVITTSEVVDRSALRPAPISASYFSFNYKVAADAVKNGGIISTDIPSLEYLSQPGSDRGTIHVKASGGITGQVIMSLTSACDHIAPDAQGRPALIPDEVDPYFAVNRTMEVHQMFGQGYVAELDVNKLVDQTATTIITHGDQGFKKTNVFGGTVNADLTSFVNFKWVSEFQTPEVAKLQDIFLIRNAVAAKLIDSYYDDLVRAKILTINEPQHVAPAQGGITNDPRVGRRCWTEHNSGYFGIGSSSSSHCENYTYTVPVWHDGVTVEQVKTALRLNAKTVDSMTVNTMTPFYFGTAFVAQK